MASVIAEGDDARHITAETAVELALTAARAEAAASLAGVIAERDDARHITAETAAELALTAARAEENAASLVLVVAERDEARRNAAETGEELARVAGQLLQAETERRERERELGEERETVRTLRAQLAKSTREVEVAHGMMMAGSPAPVPVLSLPDDSETICDESEVPEPYHAGAAGALESPRSPRSSWVVSEAPAPPPPLV